MEGTFGITGCNTVDTLGAVADSSTPLSAPNGLQSENVTGLFNKTDVSLMERYIQLKETLPWGTVVSDTEPRISILSRTHCFTQVRSTDRRQYVSSMNNNTASESQLLGGGACEDIL